MKLFSVRLALSLSVFSFVSAQSANASCDEARLLQAVEVELSHWRKVSPRKRDVRSVRELSVALARLGRTERALQVVRETAHCNSDEIEGARDEVLRIAARRLARRGDDKWALKTANRIGRAQSRTDALFAVARLHLRKGDKPSAAKVLRLAAPLLLKSQQSNVLSYGAWLLARAGDESGARQLFFNARQVPTDDTSELPQKKARSIAHFQAKAGFYDEAAATAGNNFWAISGVVRVLEERREFEHAFGMYGQLTSESERAKWQLAVLARAAEAGQREWAAQHLAVLYQQSKKENAEKPFDATIFALLYALVGDRESSQKIWTKAESSPDLQPIESAMFYLGTIRSAAIRSQFSREELYSMIDKARQAAMKLQIRDRVGILLQIAKVQQQQGMKTEMIAILLDADSAAREKLAASGDVNDNNDLLEIAAMWRKVGDETQTRAALGFIPKKVTKLRSSVAFHMASAGFWPESLRVLQSQMPRDVAFYRSFAQMQTRKKGGDPLLWVQKLKSASNRRAALSGAIEGCEPQIAEERELVLSDSGYSAGF